MILDARELRKTFSQADIPIEVLKGASFAVAPGERVAIVGQSGSGKSTLLSLISGLDRPTSGTVTIEGRDLGKFDEEGLAEFRKTNIGIVFQQFHLVSHFTALENVSLPLEIRDESDAGSRAAAALDEVGLAARHHHFPHQLSGGECQRVAIARALIGRPRLLLADEPSGNLDTKTGEAIMDLLFRLARLHDMSLVLVTHNENLAALCDRRLELREGRFA